MRPKLPEGRDCGREPPLPVARPTDPPNLGTDHTDRPIGRRPVEQPVEATGRRELQEEGLVESFLSAARRPYRPGLDRIPAKSPGASENLPEVQRRCRRTFESRWRPLSPMSARFDPVAGCNPSKRRETESRYEGSSISQPLSLVVTSSSRIVPLESEYPEFSSLPPKSAHYNPHKPPVLTQTPVYVQ